MLSGMKTFLYLLCPLNSNIGREETVEGSLNRVHIHFASGLKMGNLAEGVHPRIRPPGTNQMDGFSYEKCQFFFDHPLNGWTFGLNLPSLIIRSVVFNEEFNVSHSAYCLPLIILRAHPDLMVIAPAGQTSWQQKHRIHFP
jgi:hypothetical protein